MFTVYLIVEVVFRHLSVPVDMLAVTISRIVRKLVLWNFGEMTGSVRR